MMRLLVINHLTNAYEALRSNRLRTFLTILGVTIGVASIVVILSLSAGAAKIISDQVDQLGGTIAVVRPGSPGHDAELSGLTAALAGNTTTSSLTEHDVDTLQSIQNVSAAAPVMFIGGSVTAKGSTPKDVSIIATTPAFTQVTPIKMSDGQFIDSVTDDDTAVIGSQLSIDLFGTDQSAGRTLHTHGKQFTVIGILKANNNPVNYNNIDYDHAVFISLQSGKSFNQGVAAIQQINIRTNSQDALNGVVSVADKQLAANHNGEKDYAILSGSNLAGPTNTLFGSFAVMLVVVAAISLIVGGIGIMNIMLVGVTERTREIGIRKAIGASVSHITWQFLIEALTMSIAGGICGYLVGYLVAFSIARTFLTFDPAFTWFIMYCSAAISLFVGIIFGLYPAIRAANKDPIEALRNYH